MEGHQMIQETQGPALFRLTTALIVLATLSTALRFWAKFTRDKVDLWWDDWLCLCAWVRWIPFYSLLISLSRELHRHLSFAPAAS